MKMITGNRKHWLTNIAVFALAFVIGRTADYIRCGMVDCLAPHTPIGQKPVALQHIAITHRGVPFPMLHMDYIDGQRYEGVAVDWLDLELFGSPVVARYYRVDAPDLHGTVRSALLSTLSDQQYRIAVASLLKTTADTGSRDLLRNTIVARRIRDRLQSCRDLSARLERHSLNSAPISQHEAQTESETAREFISTKAMTMAPTETSTQGNER